MISTNTLDPLDCPGVKREGNTQLPSTSTTPVCSGNFLMCAVSYKELTSFFQETGRPPSPTYIAFPAISVSITEQCDRLLHAGYNYVTHWNGNVGKTSWERYVAS